jgi:hypothetical protein
MEKKENGFGQKYLVFFAVLCFSFPYYPLRVKSKERDFNMQIQEEGRADLIPPEEGWKSATTVIQCRHRAQIHGP